jgi:FkbH-like protein
MIDALPSAGRIYSLTLRWRRDRRLPWRSKAAKLVRFLSGRVRAPFYLADCDRIGRGARVLGRPDIENAGMIEVGRLANIASTFAPVRLIAASGARLIIGDHATINFGTSISAHSCIRLGNRVSLGPYVEIRDSDGLETGVEIGDDVWLAARVRVDKAVKIGSGTVVTAGSVVTRSLPPGVIAGGSPAVVLRQRWETPRTSGGATAADAERVRPPEAGAVVIAERPVRPTARRVLRGRLIADSTITDLAAALRRSDPALGPDIEVAIAPYDQVVQQLHGLAAHDSTGLDFCVVWTRPEAAIPRFRALMEHGAVTVDAVLEDVDEFAALVRRARPGAGCILVPTWTIDPGRREPRMADMRNGGVANTLLHMNLRLAAAFDSDPSVILLDAQRWGGAPSEGSNAKLWYLGKVAFGRDVFARAAADVRSALRGISGATRKLIVVDLDDTLWGGVVGDVGWERLRLGGHDAVGESFADFQRELRSLKSRGVLLAIASKNEEAVALEAIARHPEMILREDDFAAFRINWGDKAENVAAMAQELNLGLQSVVFIDDNPVERARVRDALPEVFVPDWPADKLLYVPALLQLGCFDSPGVTSEDRNRTSLYTEERKRRQDKAGHQSLEAWLDGLQTRVRFAPLNAGTLARAAQLLNKTNQMNLRTRRLSEAQLSEWAAAPAHELWTVHVSDRFGDAGLTGLLGLEIQPHRLSITDYVLSCRVMGRGVEETIVAAAVERARTLGVSEVVAEYARTEKNKPCLEFWRRSGFVTPDNATFAWDAGRPYAVPSYIVALGGSMTDEASSVAAPALI